MTEVVGSTSVESRRTAVPAHKEFRMSDYAPRLAAKYRGEVVEKLKEDFQYANPMMVPRLQKIVLNVSMKDAIQNVKLLETAAAELGSITGQKAVIRRARRSIANFKLREGMPIGTSVTLRRAHMWEFMDRLMSLTMPRMRDFRGVSRKAFDGRGNYSLGLREQIVFPEIDYDQVDRIHGMNITFVTTAKTDAEALALLKHLGMPFKTN
jgi:large subunit ribosomal protein L5